MVTKRELTDATVACLEAVASEAKREFGPNPKRIQKSQWMVKSNASSSSSRIFERTVFDHNKVDVWYQTTNHAELHELQQLEHLLLECGIPENELHYGFFTKLIQHWLDFSASCSVDQSVVSKVVNPFVDAVLNGYVVTRSRDALITLPLDTVTSSPIQLEQGVSIRPILEEELWEFGEIDSILQSFFIQEMPRTDWAILEVIDRHPRVSKGIPDDSTRKAVLMALPLLSPGNLRVLPLVEDVKYGIPAFLGRLPQGIHRGLNNWEGIYSLDGDLARRLQTEWSKLRAMLTLDTHYLAFAAERLLDGLGRDRPRDAIVDYTIALEALLTQSERDELRYRFALRGTFILAALGQEKRASFQKLLGLYDDRSKIVHGNRVDQSTVTERRVTGEKALRDIWWWAYQQDFRSAAELAKEIDRTILE